MSKGSCSAEKIIQSRRLDEKTIQSIISIFQKKRIQYSMKLKKIPFIRGIVALIESAGIGSRHLTFSSERYDVMPGEEAKRKLKKPPSWLWFWVSPRSVSLSFLFGKFVFTLVPVFLAEALQFVAPGKTAQILLESLFKLILLLTYISLISMTPLIKRVFQYHGAEHKVINAYENELPMTVENVQAQSRLHFRCGSSFILFTVIVGMFIYFLVPTDPFWLRIVNRILLIPVVLGVSFRSVANDKLPPECSCAEIFRLSRTMAPAYDNERT